MMSEFESALRKLHAAGKKRFGDEWIQRLERRRAILEGAYATLYEQDRDPIAYESLSAQTTYVFAYAPARAEYTRQFLHRHKAAVGGPLFSSANIKVVSFGGGPASELVGLVRYLEEDADEIVENIEYTIYDKDGEWSEVASNIIDDLKTDIEIDAEYIETDVISRTKMNAIDLSGTDMVVFSYIMSELAKLGRNDRIAENFRSTLGNMKIGAKILFIDNCHPIFIKFFQSCKLVSGLNQRNDNDDRVECEFPDFKGTFETLSKALDWTPRTDLRCVSKLIVRTSA